MSSTSDDYAMYRWRMTFLHLPHGSKRTIRYGYILSTTLYPTGDEALFSAQQSKKMGCCATEMDVVKVTEDTDPLAGSDSLCAE